MSTHDSSDASSSPGSSLSSTALLPTYARQPSGAISIDELLIEARSHLTRCTVEELSRRLNQSENEKWGPTHVVDIRPAAQRELEGQFKFGHSFAPSASSTSTSASDNSLSVDAGAQTQSSQHKIHIIERNVLEWRLDPQNDARIRSVVDTYGYATRIVVICSEGYTSSLAARELQRLGLKNATDLVGGCKAWSTWLKDHESQSMT